GAFSGANSVNLQANEAAGVQIIAEIGTRHAVDPTPNVIALRDDAVVVPLAIPVGLRSVRLLRKVVQPLGAPRLVPKIPGDSFLGLGDFALITINVTSRANLASFRGQRRVFLVGVAANLHAGVQ